jgi:hypothetical protein
MTTTTKSKKTATKKPGLTNAEMKARAASKKKIVGTEIAKQNAEPKKRASKTKTMLGITVSLGPFD